ncbi:MAG: UPF0149 family protein [Gammaproteobacteria bacterium]
MKKRPFFTCLSPHELNRLGAFLHRFPGSMNLETMDGFFSALICVPQTVIINSICSKVWGRKAKFNDIEEAYEIANLIVRHWNSILQTLNQGDLYHPLLLQDKAGVIHANDWACGFNLGMCYSNENWDELFRNERHKGWIFPIIALAFEHHPDPVMRPDFIDNAQRQLLIVDLRISLKNLHDYFHSNARPAEYQTLTPHCSRGTMLRHSESYLCESSREYKHYSNTIDRPLLSQQLH